MPKKWTVWYSETNLRGRILKFLFGLRGCKRVDCDDISFGPFPVGFATLIDDNSDSAQFIWILQIEQYSCNFGLSDSQKELMDRMRQYEKEHIAHMASVQKAQMTASSEAMKEGNNSPVSSEDGYV